MCFSLPFMRYMKNIHANSDRTGQENNCMAVFASICHSTINRPPKYENDMVTVYVSCLNPENITEDHYMEWETSDYNCAVVLDYKGIHSINIYDKDTGAVF